jgi:hypothetical protein
MAPARLEALHLSFPTVDAKKRAELKAVRDWLRKQSD